MLASMVRIYCLFYKFSNGSCLCKISQEETNRMVSLKSKDGRLHVKSIFKAWAGSMKFQLLNVIFGFCKIFGGKVE